MLDISTNEPVVVIDFLARLCLKCGEDITFSHGLSKYCKTCNQQRHALRELECWCWRHKLPLLQCALCSPLVETQIDIDRFLSEHNKDRAFSTFGKHDPADEVRLPSVKRRKEDEDRRVYFRDERESKHTHFHEPDAKTEPKFNIVTPEDHDWATRQRSTRRLKNNWQPSNAAPAELKRKIGNSGHGKRVTAR
jgi:hypothetical protein